jgi:putative transposase
MPRYRRATIPGGTFFFTVAIADRSDDLLTRYVDRLRHTYQSVSNRLPFETIAICILPDHLHAIWSLPENDSGFSMRWSLIKSGFSRGLAPATSLSPRQRAKREKGLWQRRYWEHAIRDGSDLERHIDYIHFNPVKHGLVARVCDWPHSSFHRYVARGELPMDWAGDAGEIVGSFGER